MTLFFSFLVPEVQSADTGPEKKRNILHFFQITLPCLEVAKHSLVIELDSISPT